MEILRRDKTVKFSTLMGGTVFLAHGDIPYLKLTNPVVLKHEPDREFTAVHLGMSAMAAVTPDTECVPLIGRFVEDAK